MSKRHLELLWLLPATVISSPAYATDYLSVEQAQKALFPDASEFISQPVKLTDEQKDKVTKEAGVRQRKNEQPAWRVQKDGKHVGWFVVDEVIGKHEYITYAIAIAPEGRVLGVEVMSYRETHGGQVRDANWRKRFNGKTLSDPFKLDVDVPNISGATLSCRNILDGVKRVLILHKIALANG
jgi:Na+-translocating ferredoxin:NAD+ oxidoreductase RnfG subunit